MTFPTTLDTDFGTLVDNVTDVEASNVNDLRRAVEGLEAKVGINSSAVAASLDYKVNNFFVTGRKLYLYENTAPTGWSIVAVTDKVLAVKGGSDAYNVNGGNTAGTWTQPSHALITAELPIHTHTIGSGGSHTHQVSAYAAGIDGTGWGTASASSSSVTSDSGGSHTHTAGNAGSGSSHNHGSTYRPAAAVGVIVEKT